MTLIGESRPEIILQRDTAKVALSADLKGNDNPPTMNGKVSQSRERISDTLASRDDRRCYCNESEGLLYIDDSIEMQYEKLHIVAVSRYLI